MSWTPERTTINQKVQIGAESTTALGTPVAAGKILECFDWTFGINGDIVDYTPTGRKYVTIKEENTEWVDGTLAGKLDYNGVIYPLAGAMGSVSPTAANSSLTAKAWVFNPPLTGSIVPQTYTLQQGDSVRAHQTAYSLFTMFGYNMTRKDVNNSGKFITQPILDAATPTSNPTKVVLAPVVAKQVNVYLDSTSGGLGTTKLLRVLSFDYSFDNVYGPFYVLNSTNLGFTAHVDLMPKAQCKLKVEADAAGMALLTYLQAGTTYFLRVVAQGSQIAADGGAGTDPVYNLFQHDMAVKVDKPSTFADDQGIFAIEWGLTVVEDETWGKSQTLLVQNLITAL